MKKIRFTFLILCVVFCGFAAGVFLEMIKPRFDAKHVLENGTETTATLINIGTNFTLNNEPFYYIRLFFVNSDGVKITVKTNSLYSENFLINIGLVAYSDVTYKFDAVPGKKFQVMYLGNKAVLKDFVTEGEDRPLWIILLAFGTASVVMFIAYVLNIATDIRNFKIKQFGVDGTGIYLEHREVMKINDEPYYRIHFTFKNDYENIVEAKTGSFYPKHEAEALSVIHSFPIKYMGNKAVIILDDLPGLEDPAGGVSKMWFFFKNTFKNGDINLPLGTQCW